MNHFHPVYETLHCGDKSGLQCTNPKDIDCPACRENERRQYRLTVTFPRLRFADTNILMEQLIHLDSELTEIETAADDARFGLDTYEHVAEEVIDLMQSCTTLLYILKDQHGINPDDIVKQVQGKNRNRGYEERAAISDSCAHRNHSL